ncbi:MAG: hypothetical protein Q9172_005839 [Xanthocarpia lactea]
MEAVFGLQRHLVLAAMRAIGRIDESEIKSKHYEERFYKLVDLAEKRTEERCEKAMKSTDDNIRRHLWALARGSQVQFERMVAGRTATILLRIARERQGTNHSEAWGVNMGPIYMDRAIQECEIMSDWFRANED